MIIKGVCRQCQSLADFQPVTLKINKHITETVGSIVESKPVGKESDLIHCGRNEGIIGKPLRLQTEQKKHQSLNPTTMIWKIHLLIIIISKMPAVFLFSFSSTAFKLNSLERHANYLKW